jgi:hypothetical protein
VAKASAAPQVRAAVREARVFFSAFEEPSFRWMWIQVIFNMKKQ